MANGTAVRVAPITPELPAANEPFDPQLGGVEGWIDAIVIALADMSAQAVRELQAGRLTDKRGCACCRGRSGSASLSLSCAAARRTMVRLGAAALDEIIAVVGEVASAVRAMN